MNIATYSHNNYKKLWWLVPLLLVALLIALGVWIHGMVVDGKEQEAKVYQTALQIQNNEQLNYSIDTHQGNILSWVSIKAVTPVKFPEMNKTFLAVEKVKEKYTRHEEEDCTTDDQGNESCTTHVYYSWDYAGSDTIESPEVEIAGRRYLTSVFGISSHTNNASNIIDGATDREWYPDNRKVWMFTDDGDIRYYYNTTDIQVSGSIFANTNDGTLKPVSGKVISLSPKSVSERVSEALTSVSWAKWGFIVFWTIITLAAGAGSAYWLYENIQ